MTIEQAYFFMEDMYQLDFCVFCYDCWGLTPGLTEMRRDGILDRV
jgi:hypothetical protein